MFPIPSPELTLPSRLKYLFCLDFSITCRQQNNSKLYNEQLVESVFMSILHYQTIYVVTQHRILLGGLGEFSKVVQTLDYAVSGLHVSNSVNPPRV